MAIEKISDSVFSVGVAEPCVRTIDAVFDTPFGTSYNSYFIFDRTTALIDVAPIEYREDYMYNLSQICDIGDINFLILTGFYPEQNKMIEEIIKNSPQITVVCTEKAKEYLCDSMQNKPTIHTVKTGDTLNLGSIILQFTVCSGEYSDSMHVYNINDNLLFSGRFFSCHYYEINTTNDKIRNCAEYLSLYKQYFNIVFKPYTEQIEQLIIHTKEKNAEIIAPRNGAVLVDEPQDSVLQYQKWCAELVQKSNSVIILYAGRADLVNLANVVAETIGNQNFAEVIIINAEKGKEKTDKINSAKLVIVIADTVCHGVPSCLIKAFADVNFALCSGKKAVGFVRSMAQFSAENQLGNFLNVFGFENCVLSLPNNESAQNKIIDESLRKI